MYKTAFLLMNYSGSLLFSLYIVQLRFINSNIYKLLLERCYLFTHSFHLSYRREPFRISFKYVIVPQQTDDKPTYINPI